MYVKSKMTLNPHTIAVEAPIIDVISLMKEKGLKRVPVLEGEKCVGIITEGDIQKVSPNKATSLSIFEINYLLGKTTVKNAMSKSLYTISQEAFIEEAAVLMRDNQVSALPVLDGQKLVGIITESNIFDAFIELLGFRDAGSRIAVESKDKPGALADIAKIIADAGANISHIADYKMGEGITEIIIRVDTLATDRIEKDLQSKGYGVININKNM